jgi:serine/threonine protein kinase
VSTDDIEREIDALNRLLSESKESTHIVQVFRHSWLDSVSPLPSYYIDMELCSLSLEDYIWGRRADFVDAHILHSPERAFIDSDCSPHETILNLWVIMSEVSEGVEFVHNCGIVHGDLKPSNGKKSL